MKNLHVAGIGIFVVGIAGLGLFSGSTANEPEPPESVSPEVVRELKLETLLTAQLEGVENTDVIVNRVTIPDVLHHHPRPEFAFKNLGAELTIAAALNGLPLQIAVEPFKRLPDQDISRDDVRGGRDHVPLVFRIGTE